MSRLQSLLAITKRTNKRVGRGYGSGKGGHTSTRGMKGQNSRNGGKRPLWFEGGQLPLIKRLPMWRGKGKLESFERTAAVSLTELSKMQATNVSLDTLKLEKVIAQRFRGAKVVAHGSVKRPVVVTGLKVTQLARRLIEKAGGSVVE